MKRTMLAILAISPLMMHGQVKSSAQPGSTPTLESSNVQPAAFAGIKLQTITQSQPSFVFRPASRHRCFCTRWTLIATIFWQVNAEDDRVVRVAMTIDASGKPTDLKVIQSSDQFTDEAILAAASQYRFKPATLNGSAVPIEMTVNFKIQ